MDPDDVEAVEWYRKSARQGNSTSQWLLGLCYEQGKGVIQNYKEAVECYRKSAEQDNASAQYHLGLCYEKGYGVVQDYGQAIFWYQKSANQGYSKAEHRLEICYRGQDIDAGCYVSYLDDSGLEGYDFSRLRLKRDL